MQNNITSSGVQKKLFEKVQKNRWSVDHFLLYKEDKAKRMKTMCLTKDSRYKTDNTVKKKILEEHAASILPIWIYLSSNYPRQIIPKIPQMSVGVTLRTG